MSGIFATSANMMQDMGLRSGGSRKAGLPKRYRNDPHEFGNLGTPPPNMRKRYGKPNGAKTPNSAVSQLLGGD